MGNIFSKLTNFKSSVKQRRVKKINFGKDGVLITDDGAPFSYIESFNLLAVNLTYSLGAEKGKKVMFTSANPDSGKSLSVVNTAIALANMGKKVLVLDCDFANNSIAQYFGQIGITKGISDVVCNNIDLSDVIQSTSMENLNFISCGFSVPDPQRVVSMDGFKEIFVQLGKEYDWILIDLPPVNLFAYVAIVHRLCDGSILLLDKKNDFTVDVNHAIELVKSNLIGVVVNRVDVKNKKYNYNYNYGYGYSKSNKKED